MTQPVIHINGERAYLYKVGAGCYSNYSEHWYWHRESFTDVQLLERLLMTLPSLVVKENARRAERDAYSRAHFGCDANGIGWDFERDALGVATGRRLPKTPKGTADDLTAWFANELSSSGWEPRQTVLEAAGFVSVVPTAYWSTDDQYLVAPDAYETQLRRELAEAQQSEARRA